MIQPTTLQVLQLGRQSLLEGPHTWTQGVAHRNAAGDQIIFGSQPAVSSCSLGHLDRGVHIADPFDEDIHLYSRAYRVLAKVLGWDTDTSGASNFVAGWNDAKGRTYEEIIDLFDKAILLAAAELEAPVEPSTPLSGGVQSDAVLV